MASHLLLRILSLGVIEKAGKADKSLDACARVWREEGEK